MGQIADPFEYLAFDEERHSVLAHGTTPLDALLNAVHLAPGIPTRVLKVGALGRMFWNLKSNLEDVRAKLIARDGTEPQGWVLLAPDQEFSSLSIFDVTIAKRAN